MTAFIKLTIASPKCMSVKVRIGSINKYQELEVNWSTDTKAVLWLVGDDEALYVTETSQEIDVLIRMATR